MTRTEATPAPAAVTTRPAIDAPFARVTTTPRFTSPAAISTGTGFDSFRCDGRTRTLKEPAGRSAKEKRPRASVRVRRSST